MKICTGCNSVLPLKDYYKRTKPRLRYTNKCKVCTREDVRINALKVGDGYDSSEKGVIRVLYKTQKRNNKLRGFGDMPYSKQEFSLWLYENNYKELYNFWFSNGKNKEDKPSVDRLDDFKGYSFDNIRLVTWKENKGHQYSDILKGEGTSGKRCHGILQYTLQGELVKEFVSYQEVRRVMKYCVNHVIKNKDGIKNGYLWKLKD